MFSSQAIRQDFSRAAKQYDEAASLQKRVRGRAVTLAKECWPKDSSILDVGCGTGALVADAQGLGWRVTGIDVAFGMCAVARRHAPLANADAGALPFADAAFDGVFSSLMLQWTDAAQVFSEMARVIIPRGRCVVATLLPGTLHELETAFAALDDAPHVSRFATKEALFSAAVAAALRVHSASEETVIDYYPDAEELMRSIKAIGAVNKAPARRRGLMTPQRMARLTQTYAARFGGAGGIPATWQVLYMVLEKV